MAEPKATILTADELRRGLTRIAHEIVERNKGAENLAIIGIHTRGIPLAERLAAGLDPSEVIATTFTVKAADELSQRVRSTLLDRQQALQQRAVQGAIEALGVVADAVSRCEGPARDCADPTRNPALARAVTAARREFERVLAEQPWVRAMLDWQGALAEQQAVRERGHHARAVLGLPSTVVSGPANVLPMLDGRVDFTPLGRVLHYLADPAAAVAEAARLVSPGGRLLIVDFAPHDFEHMREAHQHRRLGFADSEIAGWLTEAGLKTSAPIALPPDREGLTVTIWTGERPAVPSAVQDRKTA